MNEKGSLFAEFLIEDRKVEFPVIVRIATNRKGMNTIKFRACHGSTIRSVACILCRYAGDLATRHSTIAFEPHPSSNHLQFRIFLEFKTVHCNYRDLSSRPHSDEFCIHYQSTIPTILNTSDHSNAGSVKFLRLVSLVHFTFGTACKDFGDHHTECKHISVDENAAHFFWLDIVFCFHIINFRSTTICESWK